MYFKKKNVYEELQLTDLESWFTIYLNYFAEQPLLIFSFKKPISFKIVIDQYFTH